MISRGHVLVKYHSYFSRPVRITHRSYAFDIHSESHSEERHTYSISKVILIQNVITDEWLGVVLDPNMNDYIRMSDNDTKFCRDLLGDRQQVLQVYPDGSLLLK